jgi:hypothetical protein
MSHKINKHHRLLPLIVLFNFFILIYFGHSAFADHAQLLGQWKIKNQTITLGDGTQRTSTEMPMLISFYENGIYVIPFGDKGDSGGSYTIENSNHVKFGNLKNIDPNYIRFPLQATCKFIFSNNELVFINEAPFTNPFDFPMSYEGIKKIETVFVNISKGENKIFQPPDLNDYQLSKEWDDNSVWIKDTHVMKYTNRKGDKIYRYSTNKHVWGWTVVLSNAKETGHDLTKNYKIRDSKCNGKFDEKYSLEEAWPGSPACARWSTSP